MNQNSLRAANDGGNRDHSDRLTVLAFLTDTATEQAVHDGLADIVTNGLDLRRGTIRDAIAAMTKLSTPEVLIIDISGEDQPLQTLHELSEVVEPGVRVLVIGETDDMDFYRHITRGMGVMEYIFKPVTREAIARHFAPFITRQAVTPGTVPGGRVIAVLGARGGVGATTIAANLATFLGTVSKRHTVFVDADLHMGSGALLLGARTGPGLRMALETPDRIDPLFVERATQPVSGRLHVLASEEKLNNPLSYAPGAARRLIEVLRIRYNFMVLDVPFLPLPCNRELLEHAQHQVIVMDPSLASVRDTLRLLALPNGRWQPQRPTLVLNRYGRSGSLSRKQVEDALNVKVDVVIPCIPKQLNECANLGEPVVLQRGPLRQSIVDLSRQVGFAAVREEEAGIATNGAAFYGLFRKLMPRRVA